MDGASNGPDEDCFVFYDILVRPIRKFSKGSQDEFAKTAYDDLELEKNNLK